MKEFKNMEVILVVFLYLILFCVVIAIALIPVYFCTKWGRSRELVVGRPDLNALICGLIGLFLRYPGMLLVYLLPRQ